MPQAAIRKERDPHLWEEDIGHHSEIANYEGQVDSKPQAASVKRRSQGELGPGVNLAVPTHDRGDRG